MPNVRDETDSVAPVDQARASYEGEAIQRTPAGQRCTAKMRSRASHKLKHPVRVRRSALGEVD